MAPQVSWLEMAELLLAVLFIGNLFGLAVANDDAFAMLTALTWDRDTGLDYRERKLVEYWMDAGTAVGNEADSRCSVDYVRQLQSKIEADIQDSLLKNVIELYYFAELDLLSSCGDRVADLAEEVILSKDDRRKVQMVVEEFNNWYYYESNQTKWIALQCVAENMMWTMGAERCLNQKSFVSTWRRGPCSRVLNKLDQPHMQPLQNYLTMIADTRLHPSLLVSHVNPEIVALAQCCVHFRSGQALIEAWDALQTSFFYQWMRNQLALRNAVDSN